MVNVTHARILVVDDAKTIRMMVVGFLRELGVKEVIDVEDGKAALNVMGSNKFDLVICDWYMPELTGIELIRKVKAQDALSAPPFLMITTEKQCASVKEAMAFGVDEYLVKPFNAEQLCKKVKNVLNQRQQLSSSLEGLSMLLVEDSRSVRLLLKQMLTNLGAEDVYEADSVKESLGLLEEHKDLDVIVCDWNMPETNGLEFLKMLRENKKTDHLAYVMVSSESKEAKVKAAVQSGVDEYLMKPFQPTEISKKILRAIQRRKASLHKNFRR